MDHQIRPGMKYRCEPRGCQQFDSRLRMRGLNGVNKRRSHHDVAERTEFYDQDFQTMLSVMANRVEHLVFQMSLQSPLYRCSFTRL